MRPRCPRRPVPQAAGGGKSSDTALVWEHTVADCRAASASGAGKLWIRAVGKGRVWAFGFTRSSRKDSVFKKLPGTCIRRLSGVCNQLAE